MLKILNPADREWVDNSQIYAWRTLLKKHLLTERNLKSDLSGRRISNSTGVHMHEGIISRAVVPKSVWWHYLIYHSYNSFLLLPEEHIPNPPSKQWAIEQAFARYGQENVCDWFYSLPWKAIPFRI